MSDNQEPFVPQANSLWGYQSEAWYARFDYINNRVEAYLNNFRDSVDYDFTKTTGRIEDAQKELNLAMEEFAVGNYAAEKVKRYAVILRDAFKRPEERRSELALASDRYQNPPPVNQDNYIPGSIYFNRMGKVSGKDRIHTFIEEHNKRLFFAGESPPPGVTSSMVEGGGGFDATGMPLSQYEAELRIDTEVWDIMIELFGGERNISKCQAGEEKTAEIAPTNKPEEIKTSGKTVDQIKTEAEALKHKPKTKKR